MAKKIFTFYGKTIEELHKMSIKEFAELLPARERRSLKKLTERQKILLKKVNAKKKNIKTHCRDIVVVPAMVGILMRIYNGKEFFQVNITEDMLGHRLGEFAVTRNSVKHSAPGIGATRSSAAMSVK